MGPTVSIPHNLVPPVLKSNKVLNWAKILHAGFKPSKEENKAERKLKLKLKRLSHGHTHGSIKKVGRFGPAS